MQDALLNPVAVVTFDARWVLVEGLEHLRSRGALYWFSRRDGGVALELIDELPSKPERFGLDDAGALVLSGQGDPECALGRSSQQWQVRLSRDGGIVEAWGR